jgi:hypothetical protein
VGSAVLATMLERVAAVAASGRLPIVVFDLDSTIFDTAGRHYRILGEFVNAHAEELRDLYAQVSHTDFGWSVSGPLEARGFDHAPTLEELGKFWFARFFTDDYVGADLVVPGAADFVGAVHAAGGFVYYLTGRHVGGMEIGTARALGAHGFPLWDGRTLLHMKPDFHTGDHAFKAEALDHIRALRGEVVGTFDNEPANCNLFAEQFPSALNVWLRTTHSPTAPALRPDVLETVDFVVPG